MAYFCVKIFLSSFPVIIVTRECNIGKHTILIHYGLSSHYTINLLSCTRENTRQIRLQRPSALHFYVVLNHNVQTSLHCMAQFLWILYFCHKYWLYYFRCPSGLYSIHTCLQKASVDLPTKFPMIPSVKMRASTSAFNQHYHP